MKVNIREEYNNLKYKLPKFDEINEDFELEFIKENKFLLRQIRRRMNEKIIFFCRIIEDLLYPTQQHIINATEINNFSEDKKRRMNNMYKELMYYERESLYLDVNPDEKKDVEFINNVFNFWKIIKKDTGEIVKLMQQSWKKQDFRQEKNNYFG